MRYLSNLLSISIIAVMAAAFVSCSSGNDSDDSPQPVDTELTITGLDKQWTYISLETNKVVGTSPLNDSGEQWSARTDWDLAICGDMIKTNSGSSGCGKGGLRRIDSKSYEEVTASDAVSVDLDRPQSPDSERH